MQIHPLSFVQSAINKWGAGAIVSSSGLVLLVIIIWWVFGPVAQDPSYHDFADRRTLLGIPNSVDVLSNIPFCLLGLLGLVLLQRNRHIVLPVYNMYLIFCVSIFLTGLGSAYYHLEPSDATLVWDRLPLSIAFMSFLSLVIAHQINLELGRKIIYWLVIAGPCSVIYWHWTGDLRPYLLLQFGSLLLLPLILWRFRDSYASAFWGAIIFYTAAKVFEFLDEQIFVLSKELISGHSLKHIAGSLTTFMVVTLIGMDIRKSRELKNGRAGQ